VKQRWTGGLGVLMMWFGMVSAATAAEVSLMVSTPSALAEGGTAQARLRIGVVAGATAGFDTQWDVPAPPTPSDSVVTLLAGVVPSPILADRQLLLWDFREETFPQTWTIDVTSDQASPVTLSWQATGSGNACVPVAWTLEDSFSGNRVDLNASSSHSYQYVAPEPRTRRFVVTAETPLVQQPRLAPRNLWSPRQGRASVYLAWSGGATGDVQYHVYRQTDQGTVRLTTTPIGTASYVVTGADRSTAVTYRVTAVTEGGCESDYSVPLTLPAHR
jgi:hypothetical protein